MEIGEPLKEVEFEPIEEPAQPPVQPPAPVPAPDRELEPA